MILIIPDRFLNLIQVFLVLEQSKHSGVPGGVGFLARSENLGFCSLSNCRFLHAFRAPTVFILFFPFQRMYFGLF